MPSPCVWLKYSFASHHFLDPYFPSAAQVRYREQELLLRCVHAIIMEGEAAEYKESARSRRQRDAKLKRQGIEPEELIIKTIFILGLGLTVQDLKIFGSKKEI